MIQPTVNVFMEGGVIHNVEVPEGVKVVVYDYDTEGADADRLSKDGKGDDCLITTWFDHGPMHGFVR